MFLSIYQLKAFKLSHAAQCFYEKVKLGKHKELFPLFYFCPLTLTCSNVSPGPFVLKCPVCRVRVGPSRRRGIVTRISTIFLQQVTCLTYLWFHFPLVFSSSEYLGLMYIISVVGEDLLTSQNICWKIYVIFWIIIFDVG